MSTLPHCRYDQFVGLMNDYREMLDLFTLAILSRGTHCWIREKNLSEMKKHIKEKHDESTSISHLKIDRNSESEVNTTYYSLLEV